jgi:translation initiation factor IF-2
MVGKVPNNGVSDIMAKVRVFSLAKELGMSSKDLITQLARKGITVKTASSSIDKELAIKCLGSDKSEDAAAPRPRTVLRRRRKEVEEAPPEVVVAPPVEDVAPVAAAEPEVTPEVVLSAEGDAIAPIEVAESVASAPAPVETPVADVSIPEAVAITDSEAVASKDAPVEATPAIETPSVAAKEVKDASAQEPAKAAKEETKEEVAPQNVIRHIDPDAIRNRLKGEGRHFKPSYNKVREIKVVSDNKGNVSRMVDMTAVTAAPTGGGGARPGKKKQETIAYGRDRREGRSSGGRDLWQKPGRKRKTAKSGKQTEITQAAAHKRVIEITETIAVSDLAHRMAVKSSQVIGSLMGMGMMVTVNQSIDYETAAIVAEEFEFEVKNVAFEETDLLTRQEDTEEEMALRAPVVTVMGHVDHGKTTLLDAFRAADVVSGEAGGITQHIGAYSVKTDKGMVTFLDTPGHAAFTAMRARGAGMTDIVILVVAADDGVMPQTKEAINHAKAAGVPLVVAINKIDRPDAKKERIMQELTEHGVIAEEWGGDTQMFPVSALKKQGLDELLDGLVTLSEMMELQANDTKPAVGTIVEAQLDKGRGPVATVLVQAGELKYGDFVVAGEFSGKVRSLFDPNGQQLKIVGPSTPVQVLGLSGVPNPGDPFDVVESDKTAKTIADHRKASKREVELKKTSRVSLDNFLSQPMGAGGSSELRVIVKADVHGSVEALAHALKGLSTTKVRVEVPHQGVGTITESDMNLAAASGAIIIGFNSKPDAKAQSIALQEKIDVRTYDIIYEALDDVKAAMTGLLSPDLVEKYQGKVEVREIFNISKVGTIAGAYVTDGKVSRAARVKVLRGGQHIFEGDVDSLKRFKDDVREVQSGYECGVSLKNYNKIEQGDILEFFIYEEIAADLGERLEDIVPPPPVAEIAEGEAEAASTEASAPA